eukprot:g10325.t1
MTSVIESQFDKRIKVIKAGGEANYTLITKTAKAKAKKMVLDTEAKVLENIKDQLHLVKKDLVSYQRYAALPIMSDAKLFYGFGSESQVLVDAPRVMSPIHERIVQLKLHVKLQAPGPGERFAVLGSHEALGCWNPSSGLQLEWKGNAWETQDPVAISPCERVEFKFVRVRLTPQR